LASRSTRYWRSVEMTNRSRLVLVSAMILALCVIATSLILVLKPGDGLEPNRYFILGFAVIAGALSVLAVYLLKVRKSEPEKILNPEFYREYEMIKDRIALSQLPVRAKREVADDVLEMLITSQKGGRRPADAIGDPIRFADQIIASFANPAKFMLLDILDSVFYLVVFVLLTSLAIWAESPGMGLFEVSIGYNMVLLFFLISFVLIPVSKALTATRMFWAYLLPLAFGIGYIAFIEILRRNFYSSGTVAKFLDSGMPMIPGYWALALYILAVPAAMVVKNVLRKGIIRRA